MIKRAKELAAYDIPAPCGGTGFVHIQDFLYPVYAHGAGRGFVIATMPVGSSCGVHEHRGDCETYYILKGTAKVTDNGEEHVLMPGDMIFCDDGCTHSIANIGSEDLVYISVILYTNLKRSEDG